MWLYCQDALDMYTDNYNEGRCEEIHLSSVRYFARKFLCVSHLVKVIVQSTIPAEKYAHGTTPGLFSVSVTELWCKGTSFTPTHQPFSSFKKCQRSDRLTNWRQAGVAKRENEKLQGKHEKMERDKEIGSSTNKQASCKAGSSSYDRKLIREPLNECIKARVNCTKWRNLRPREKRQRRKSPWHKTESLINGSFSHPVNKDLRFY